MARAHGSVGITRRDFEADFWRFCHENDFKPGEECARLMQRAAEMDATRDFVQLMAVFSKTVAPGDTGDGQPNLPLIVDRSRVADAA